MTITLLILINIIQLVVTNTPSFWESIASNPLYIVLTIVGSAASILGLFKGYQIGIIDFILPLKWRKQYRECITKDIRDLHLKNKIYIQPYITEIPPQSSHEPAEIDLKDKKPLKDYFLNEIFIKDPKEDSTVFFLFGDSGTGKSAALVHLFIDYSKKYNTLTQPFHIRLISLRDSKALDNIKRIPVEKRKKYILLLDAMDETPEVKKPTQYIGFLEQLKEAFHDYARVIITCRPQFFPNSQAEETITNPEIQTSTYFVGCTNYYLAPFDDQQIEVFLNHSISFRSNSEKLKKAMTIVKENRFIAIRPLVLTYIHDIVEKNEPITTTLALYDIIIESILKRDIDKTKKQKNEKELNEKIKEWWEASSNVASYMYQHNKLTITDTELEKILPHSIDKSFKQRSLLTRYGNEYHFSHKSFYEYFMAHRFFFYSCEIEQLYGMDFALQLFDELYDAYCNKQTIRFANFQKTTNHSVAYSLSKIGVGLSKINHFSQAETKFQHALTIRRQLAKEKNDAYLPNVAIELGNLANLHRKTNCLQEAEAEYNEALTINRQLAKDKPNAYLPNVAMTLSYLANLHRKTNRCQEAEEEYNEALTIHRQLAKNNPNTYLPNVAMTLGNLAELHRKNNCHQEAEAEFNEALTINRQLAKDNSNAYLPNVAITLSYLAKLHRKTNRLQYAEAEYNEALAIHRQLADKNPDANLPNVAITLDNLANLHRKTNCHKVAEVEYNEALTINRQLAKDNPNAYLPNVAITLCSLAELHRKNNCHQEAEAEFNEALTINRQLAKDNPNAYLPNVAIMLNDLANLHRQTNRHQEAETELNEALTINRQLAKDNSDAYLPNLANTLSYLADLHRITNRNKEAEAEYNEALTIRRQLADKNPDANLPYVAITLNNLANLHIKTNRHQEAEAEYNEALTTYRQLADNNPDAYLPNVAMTLNNLAVLHRVTNRHQEAEAEINEALTIRRQLAEKNPDAYLPNVAGTLFNFALLHIAQENLPSAEAAALESLEKYRIMAEKSPEAFDQRVKRVEILLEKIRQMMKENK